MELGGNLHLGSRAWLPVRSGSLAAAASHSFNISEGDLYHLVFEANLIGAAVLQLRFNSDTGSNYNWTLHYHGRNAAAGVHTAGQTVGDGRIVLNNFGLAGDYLIDLIISPGIRVSTVAYVVGLSYQFVDSGNYLSQELGGNYNGAAAITSFQLIPSVGNISLKYLLEKARG